MYLYLGEVKCGRISHRLRHLLPIKASAIKAGETAVTFYVKVGWKLSSEWESRDSRCGVYAKCQSAACSAEVRRKCCVARLDREELSFGMKWPCTVLKRAG